MSSPWTGDPATDDTGLLAPFRIRQSRKVLDADCGLGDVSVALAERGLDVVALESDPTLGNLARARLGTHPNATFEPLSLQAWSDGHPELVGTIDLLILRRRVGVADDPGAASDLAADLQRADRLLGPAGVVIVAVEVDARSDQDVTADGTEGAAAAEAAAVAEGLDRSGFLDRQRFVRYPEHGPDLAVVSDRLWDRPDGAAMLQLVVRDPVRPPPPGIGRQRDRRAIFGAIGDIEAWLGHADRIVVAAARDHASLADVTRPGYAWLMSVGPAPPWHVTRELAMEDGGWALRPIGGAVARSGPLTFDPVTAALPAGENGEDVLARWLLGWGWSIPRSREWFAAWWDAAERAIAESPSDRLAIDVQPRNFVVTRDRVWHLIAQDLTMRFALPREVLAFRGIVDLLVRRVLSTGWIPDLPPEATVADAALAILTEIGLSLDDPMVHLWVELEADILVRTGPNPDRNVHRGRCRAVLEQPVAEMLADLPLSRHIDGAALLAERSREIRWLNEELYVARRDLEASRAESVERRAALEDLREESLRLAAEVARTRDELADTRADLERLRSSAARQRLDLERRVLELADAERRLAKAEAWAARPLPGVRTAWWRRVSSRLREDNAQDLIAASGYFDAEWYERHYPDVASSGLDPIVHYLRYGAAEGRDPSPRFDTRAYIARNPDVSAEGVNPLLHFIRHGSSEGRQVTTSSDDRAPIEPGLPHESMSGDGSDLVEPTTR